MAADDEFLDKAVEGLVLYAFNKGEVCTCPSRALIQASIYEPFMARCLERIAAIKQGNPLDTETMIGPQVSADQLEKIGSYAEIGKQEGAEVLIGGHRADMGGEFADGYYFQPTASPSAWPPRRACSSMRSARCATAGGWSAWRCRPTTR